MKGEGYYHNAKWTGARSGRRRGRDRVGGEMTSLSRHTEGERESERALRTRYLMPT